MKKPEVVLARVAGFCLGVREAVRKAEEAVREGRVTSLGPVIHHPGEVERLGRMGVRPASSLEEVEGDTVLIRAHGAPPRVYEEIHSRGWRVVDATCPFVRLLQRKARSYAQKGYQVILVGDPTHPEVVGVAGWSEGRVHVVSSPEEVDLLPPAERRVVLAQTTQRPELLERVADRLRQRGGEVRVEKTICRATEERQEAARELAREVPVVVVIGGKESSNARKLLSVCREAGVMAYHVETAADLRPEWFRGLRKAGVTAGASTPEWVIKEVMAKMEELMQEQNEQAPELRPGEIVEGQVVSVTPERLFVDVGQKREGVVPAGEMSLPAGKSPAEVYSPGQTIPLQVLGTDRETGAPRLSHRRARERLGWQKAAEALSTGEILEGEVVEVVKGGVIVDIGVRAFMPASHVERGYVSDLSAYLGQTVRVRVIELERGRQRVVVSRKQVLEEEMKRLREKTLAELEVGQVRRGVVKSITEFGAFIDLGGIDGLLHISEMSWGKIKHPSEVLTVGDEVDVKVLRLDREKEKVSLGLKQVLPDPWSNAAEKYPVGSWHLGRVVRLASFGAFVELEPGVEGLLHVSQMADYHVYDPRDVVREGQEVKVRIVKIQPEERRISLSMKPDVQRPRVRSSWPPSREKEKDFVTLGDMFGEFLEETREKLNHQHHKN